MQQILARLAVFFSVIVIILCSGCEKTEDEIPVFKNTIAGQVLKDTNYSSFESLVGKANLAIMFDQDGPFTVLVPDDDAFAASGITQSFINGLSREQAQRIVLYHTFNGRVTVADLPPGPYAKYETIEGDSVFVTRDGSDLFLNDAKIKEGDKAVENGLYHVIDRVLLPAAGNFSTTIMSNRLDSLAKMIARVTNDSTGDGGFSTYLDSAVFTFFAPTDSAIIHWMNGQTLTDLNEVSIDSLLSILKYHITPSRVFTYDFIEGPVVMLPGNQAIIGLTNGVNGGATITGAGNGGVMANIIRTNLIFNNGVLHLVDRVLQP